MALCDLIGATCKRLRDGRWQVCPEFYFGERNGDLVWHRVEEAWTFPSVLKRRMRTFEIKKAAGFDSTGKPYLLERCPFCGGEMPSLEQARQQLLPPGNPDA